MRTGGSGEELDLYALRVREGGGELGRGVEGLHRHEGREGLSQAERRELVVLLHDLGHLVRVRG